MIFDIQLLTKPSNGLFEATAKYFVGSDKFEVSVKEISRVNKYGLDSHCVGTTYPHLTKYCYCKERPKDNGDASYMKVIIG